MSYDINKIIQNAYKAGREKANYIGHDTIMPMVSPDVIKQHMDKSPGVDFQAAASGQIPGIKPLQYPSSLWARKPNRPKASQAFTDGIVHDWANNHLHPFAESQVKSPMAPKPSVVPKTLAQNDLGYYLDQTLRKDPKSLQELHPNVGMESNEIPGFQQQQQKERQEIHNNVIQDRSFEPKKKTRVRNYFDNIGAGGGSGYTDFDDAGPFQRSRSYHPDYSHMRQVAEKSEKDPCWEDYEMAGTKKKDGKTVPNCIPKKKASITDALLNIYAADNRALNLIDETQQAANKTRARVGKSPENRGRQPSDKGNAVPKGKNLANVKPSFKSASIADALYNIYQEAYGVQMGAGSGGNYGMGQGIDMSSKSRVQAPTDLDAPAVTKQTVKKPAVKKYETQLNKTLPGTEPINPAQKQDLMNAQFPDGFSKEVDRFTQPAGEGRKEKGRFSTYDKSPLTEDSLKQLYPSLYEEKKPSKLRQFIDYLKSVHQKTFGAGEPAPAETPMPVSTNPNMGKNLAQEQYYRNMKNQNSDLVASQIQELVKTAVLDNEFSIIITAMQEMGYTVKDILNAYGSV